MRPGPECAWENSGEGLPALEDCCADAFGCRRAPHAALWGELRRNLTAALEGSGGGWTSRTSHFIWEYTEWPESEECFLGHLCLRIFHGAIHGYAAFPFFDDTAMLIWIRWASVSSSEWAWPLFALLDVVASLFCAKAHSQQSRLLEPPPGVERSCGDPDVAALLARLQYPDEIDKAQTLLLARHEVSLWGLLGLIVAGADLWDVLARNAREQELSVQSPTTSAIDVEASSQRLAQWRSLPGVKGLAHVSSRRRGFLTTSSADELLPYGLCDGPVRVQRPSPPELWLVALAASVRSTNGETWIDFLLWLELSAQVSVFHGLCEQSFLAHFTHFSCVFAGASDSGGQKARVLSGLPWRRPYPPSIVSCRVPGALVGRGLPQRLAVLLDGGSVPDLHIRGVGLEVHVCRAPQAQHRVGVTACSAPFFDLWGRELLLRDWVEYHLAIGVDRLILYDADGSAREALSSYVASGRVHLLSRFPESIAPGLQRQTAHGAPYCSALVALNHCLLSQGPFTDWVIEIHSFDEFWHVVDGPGPGSLRQLLASLGSVDEVGLLDVPQLRFGGAKKAAVGSPAFVQFTSPSAEGHTWNFANLMNPRKVLLSSMHGARLRPYLEPCRCDNCCIGAVLTSQLRVNHYADLLSPSGTVYELLAEDRSALWAAEFVRKSARVGGGRSTASQHRGSVLARVQRLLERNSSALSRLLNKAEAAAELPSSLVDPRSVQYLFFEFDLDRSSHLEPDEFLQAFDVTSARVQDRYYQLLRLRVLHAQGIRVEAADHAVVMQTFSAWDVRPMDGRLRYEEWEAGLYRTHISTRLQKLHLSIASSSFRK